MEQLADDSRLAGPPILVAVRDLIFSSRIIATARASNIEVKVLRGAAKLAGETGKRAIVDLNEPDAIAIAATWQGEKAEREVIGFVSHVDGETIKAARAAGLVKIHPRSRFVEELPKILRG